MTVDLSAFTPDAQDMAQRSYEVARRFHHPMIAREHILLAFFETPDPKIVDLFRRLGVDVASVRKKLEFVASRRFPFDAEQTLGAGKVPVTFDVGHFIQRAQLEAYRLGEEAISSPVLLSALVGSYYSGPYADRTIMDILARFGVNPGSIRRLLLTPSRPEEPNG
jgi:ATP-dependent Clp protease ATP-binding subunit ClpA